MRHPDEYAARCKCTDRLHKKVDHFEGSFH